jgi:uncharacterized repeat protein (TIGR03803 family)
MNNSNHDVHGWAVVAVLLMLATAGRAQTEKVLYNFTGGSDGSTPSNGLIFHGGALYGATDEYGTGQQGPGTVFELKPSGDGNWTETTLYAFKGGADGSVPVGNLTFDSAGNLYGSTFRGGTGTCTNRTTCGTVFELAPSSDGWAESVLYSFPGNASALPNGVISDKLGNLYGTVTGYSPQPGFVFELKHLSSGEWKEGVLHQFDTTDGASSRAGLSYRAGELYGTTYEGGSFGFGTVFKLTPAGGGRWTETVLYNFTGGDDGGLPATGVVFDATGNIFGTTAVYGSLDGGTVFTLTPSNGVWTETVIYDFGAGCDGVIPNSLVWKKGELYGTTVTGSCTSYGTVFKLTNSNGVWTETVLHAFTNGLDGGSPQGALVVDSEGNLFGTASYGGSGSVCYGGCGVVFEITP